jgi:hypothetical protein
MATCPMMALDVCKVEQACRITDFDAHAGPFTHECMMYAIKRLYLMGRWLSGKLIPTGRRYAEVTFKGPLDIVACPGTNVFI